MGKEKVINKISTIEKAFETLKMALLKVQNTPEEHEDYIFFRDSLIQRFEYCVDMFWKLMREFIIDKHGIDMPASPKGVIKEALDISLIDMDQYKHLIASINDRNLTSHAYQESVAVQIASHIYAYYQLMHHIVKTMEQQLHN